MPTLQTSHHFGLASQQRCVVVTDPQSPRNGEFDLIVLIHGGFWRAEKTPESMTMMAAEIASLGVPVACLGYRTVETGAGLDEMLSDLHHGIRAALQSVAFAEHPRVLIVGHSAGGHLALRLSEHMRGASVVALAPITQFDGPDDTALGGHAVLALHANTAGAEDDSLAETLAVRIADGEESSVAVVVHGTDDQTVPAEMSQRFAFQGRRRLQLHLVDGARHMDLIKPERDGGRYVIRLLTERISHLPW